MSIDARIGAVVVAGGRSSRMKAFKPMLPLGDSTVIRTLLSTLRSGGVSRIVVVTGRESEKLTAHIADMGVETVHNADYATTDMFCSACLGFRRLADDCDLIFFTPGDVPLFAADTLREMLERQAAAPVDILTPVCNGKKGHPVLISRRVIPALLAFRGDGGLKAAIRGFGGSKDTVSIPDKGILLDADTPADYQRLREYAASVAAKPAPRCFVRAAIGTDVPVFDDKLAELLELTEQYSALSKACAIAGVSYSGGWQKIRHAEEMLGFLLVRSSRGGDRGGGSRLTDRGREYLAAYKRFRRALDRQADKLFARYFG